MAINLEKLGRALIDSGRLSAEQMLAADKSARRRGLDLPTYLVEENLLSKDELGRAVAASEGLPYADLRSELPSHQEIAKIPEEVAREFRLVFCREDGEEMILATDSPEQARLLQVKLEDSFAPKKIVLEYALPEDLDFVLTYFYKQPLKTRFGQIIAAGGKVAQEIVEEIFHDALLYDSSDIHFEPQPDEVLVRFRVDGVLQEAGALPRNYYDTIVNYIKVQSGLRIDEHLSAQDGSFKFVASEREIDVRVSVLPILDGEKIAIRILTKSMRGFALGEIGLEVADQALLEQESRRPVGMVLAVGPTGSGKTTTLYALLKLINNPEINITTLEDPIEYRLGGVNQIQVNPQTNLTFVHGLRSIVRQDPDVIMIGEIRDRDTAEIAINAALTGHLLLSTFHANDASAAITRLIDIGIEPFLLTSTLRLIVAQRLVRRLCPHCRIRTSLTAAEIEAEYGLPAAGYFEGEQRFFRPRGCGACGQTGYKGRMGIFEIIQVTPEIQELILKRASAAQIWTVAAAAGAHSLFADGIAKVKAGLTSLEELLRVANP